jgi:hypothetical protein
MHAVRERRGRIILVVGFLLLFLLFFIPGCGENPPEPSAGHGDDRVLTDDQPEDKQTSGTQEAVESAENNPSQADEATARIKALKGLSGTYNTTNKDATFIIEIDENGQMRFQGEAYWSDPQNSNNIHFGEVEGSTQIDKDGTAHWENEYGNELDFSFSEDTLEVKETGQLGGLNVTFSGSYTRSEEPGAGEIEYKKASLPADMIDITFNDVRWKYSREDILFLEDGTFHWNEREGSDHLIERIGSFSVETSEAGNRLTLRYETVINGESRGNNEEEYFFAYDAEFLVLYTTGAVEAIFKSGTHNLKVKDYTFFADYEMYPTDLLSPYFENYFAEGGEGPGTGLSLHFLFYDLNADTQITTSVTGMVLFNGVTSDYDAYRQYNRIRSAELYLNGEVRKQLEIADTPVPRIILFPQKRASEAVLTVDDVYEGFGEENRLCVSKAYFFGEMEQD